MTIYRLALAQLVLTPFLMAGCASMQPEPGVVVPAPSLANAAAPSGPDRISVAPQGGHGGEERPAVEVLPGLERADASLDLEGLRLPDEAVRINADQMALGRFVHYTLGETLGLSYSLGDDLRNREDPVTLFMTEAIPATDFLEVVRGVLDEQGVSLAQQQGVVHVTATKRDRLLPVDAVHIGRDTPPAMVGRLLQIVPVSFLNPIVLMNMLKQDVLVDAQVELMQRTANLLIRGDADEVGRAVRYIRLLDRPGFEGREPFIFNLRHTSAEAFVADLKQILQSERIAVAEHAFEPGIFLVPLSGGRRVFVVAPDAESRRHILDLRTRLDHPEERAGDARRLHVYRPAHRAAAELADVLAQLSPSTVPAATGEGEAARAPSARAGVGDVVVDEARNALLIRATEAEFAELRETLRELDTPPQQIFVEVTVAEVTLDDQLQYGVEWYLRGNFSDVTASARTQGGLGIGNAGFLLNLGSDSGKFTAVLNALAKDKRVKILSRPRLMLHDNGVASINVGTEVPVITSEATSADLNVDGSTALLRSVQYRSTGVGLDLKARILSRDLVSLEISQRVSEAQANNTSNIDSPIILERSLTTEVDVRSGHSIVLGGLMSENDSFEENKVPVLGDVPVLGSLFRNQSRGRTRTELLVRLQPVIVAERDGQRLLETLEDALSRAP